MNKGRTMPKAIDAEKAIVNEILYDNRMIPEVEGIVRVVDFYDQRYRAMYQASLQLYSRGVEVDTISLVEELKHMGVFEKLGDYKLLSDFYSGPIIFGRIEYYARIVRQKSIARKLIGICSATMNACFDESQDVGDVMEEHEIRLTQLTTNLHSSETMGMEEAIEQTIKRIKEDCENLRNGISGGIPAHIESLTEAYGGGFKAPELIVLGARPSMGKTQHALEMAYMAGMKGFDTLFCSLEMSTVQLVKRLILRDERINEKHIGNGRMTDEEFVYLDESVDAIRPAKIFFADSYRIRNLANIKQEARRLKRKHHIRFLVIDYLGLIRTNLTFSLRQQEIAHITGELKALAKELDIAVLLLCQLSRPLKGTQGRLPVMEDLRESGDIEQDADTVLLLHKYDYYDPEAVDRAGFSCKNRGILIRAKYREGERNINFEFAHDERYKKIYDYKPAIPLPDPELLPDVGETGQGTIDFLTSLK